MVGDRLDPGVGARGTGLLIVIDVEVVRTGCGEAEKHECFVVAIIAWADSKEIGVEMTELTRVHGNCSGYLLLDYVPSCPQVKGERLLGPKSA